MLPSQKLSTTETEREIQVKIGPFSDALYNSIAIWNQLTCAVDVLETLFVGIYKSLLYINVSVVVVLVVSVVAIVSVSVPASRLTSRPPSPAFPSISSRNWDTNVDGLVVWGQI